MLSSSENHNKSKNDILTQKTRHTLRYLQDEIRGLEGERMSILNYLKTPGGGAVIAKKRVFPRVKLSIQNETMEVSEVTMAPTFIVRDGTIQSY